MRKIEKLSVLTLLAVLLTGGMIQAQDTGYQKNFKFGIALNGGLPVGDEDYFNASIGADARLQYNVTRKTSLMATTGYTHFLSDYEDAGIVPLKVGFKSFFAPDFYVSGEAGAAFGVNTFDKTSFLWSPGVGFANAKWDVSARYEAYSNYNFGQVALRVAYAFKL